jgi:hypothetical protein
MNNKAIPTYYLLSKKKIEIIPKSLESYKDCIYFLGETKKEQTKFVFECVSDFQNIYFYLEKIGFNFCGVASIENMNQSLVSEFILKETFDAIFYVEDEIDSKSLCFINGFSENIEHIQEILMNSSAWLDELESFVVNCADIYTQSYFEELVDDVSKLQNKTNEFKDKSLNYLKPNIIKYLKLD